METPITNNKKRPCPDAESEPLAKKLCYDSEELMDPESSDLEEMIEELEEEIVDDMSDIEAQEEEVIRDEPSETESQETAVTTTQISETTKITKTIATEIKWLQTITGGVKNCTIIIQGKTSDAAVEFYDCEDEGQKVILRFNVHKEVLAQYSYFKKELKKKGDILLPLVIGKEKATINFFRFIYSLPCPIEDIDQANHEFYVGYFLSNNNFAIRALNYILYNYDGKVSLIDLIKMVDEMFGENKKLKKKVVGIKVDVELFYQQILRSLTSKPHLILCLDDKEIDILIKGTELFDLWKHFPINTLYFRLDCEKDLDTFFRQIKECDFISISDNDERYLYFLNNLERWCEKKKIKPDAEKISKYRNMIGEKIGNGFYDPGKTYESSSCGRFSISELLTKKMLEKESKGEEIFFPFFCFPFSAQIRLPNEKKKSVLIQVITAAFVDFSPRLIKSVFTLFNKDGQSVKYEIECPGKRVQFSCPTDWKKEDIASLSYSVDYKF